MTIRYIPFADNEVLTAEQMISVQNNGVVQVTTFAELTALEPDVNAAYVTDTSQFYVRKADDSWGSVGGLAVVQASAPTAPRQCPTQAATAPARARATARHPNQKIRQCCPLRHSPAPWAGPAGAGRHSPPGRPAPAPTTTGWRADGWQQGVRSWRKSFRCRLRHGLLGP